LDFGIWNLDLLNGISELADNEGERRNNRYTGIFYKNIKKKQIIIDNSNDFFNPKPKI
jgi:hypothetical protein